MKKLFFALAVLVTISGCSVTSQINKYCTVYGTEVNLHDGSFAACVKCDSLAAGLYKAINKGK